MSDGAEATEAVSQFAADVGVESDPGASAPASARAFVSFRCPQCRMPFSTRIIGRERGREFTTSPCCSKTIYLDELNHVETQGQDYTSAAEIAHTAARLVAGDRAHTHGDMLANMQCIADLWNGYLTALNRNMLGGRATLAPVDVASMCELLKVARRLTGEHNLDDYVDGAGYAACAGEIAERTK